ncbi:alpha/beta hydrolase family protein [Achromobacter deleyi]|uniref:alpha/beta hydrolase family protein n=1 Tax=Achromobacter deleyi TaxID=1353891 RepID=UPI0014919A38|nr:alpha/beta hydrolase [Achromobacter deleyi]QVQ27920.1 dienelactone hydrolase [Achromobacter deleyi]UIP23531.1 alpha/beta hydrolase [Achromobacter deleyi]
MTLTFKLRLTLTFALALSAGLSQAAGFQRLNLPMDQNGPALQGAVWYPCAEPAGETKIGRAVIAAVPDCRMPGGRYPLIVMSHGSAGSYLSHHDTAAALADAGFVVAAINHVGDNAQDRSRQGYLSIFSTRPREMRRLIDYMTGAWPGKSQLDPDKVGFFGFSRGGYTGLVLAGAVPDFQTGLATCQDAPTLPMCRDIAAGKVPKQPYPQDARIKAAVIADPLNAFPGEALKHVAIPIQLWASEQGGDGVSPASVDAVRQGLGVAPDYLVARGSAHFAFLTPCSPEQTEAQPVICKDEPGFDRAAFHRDLNARAAVYFKAQLQ